MHVQGQRGIVRFINNDPWSVVRRPPIIVLYVVNQQTSINRVTSHYSKYKNLPRILRTSTQTYNLFVQAGRVDTTFIVPAI